MPLDKRTVTPKRLAANRAAAAQSTGPKTDDGKRRSAFNSFKHGLFSSQDASVRQAMSRAGYDPTAYDQLHQDLAQDWQPEGAQQSLLVDDLTRLYWLKNLHQRAHLEWHARQGAHFRIQQKLDLNRQARDRFFSYDLSNPSGWRYTEPSTAKFDGVFKCFDSLEEKVNGADWDEESSTNLFRAIYHYQLNQPGRKMKNLFKQCREEKAKAGGELAQQLKALIEQERERAREEQRLWQEHVELDLHTPLDDADPALQPLGDNWLGPIEREARLDRQINAKIRLLIRLKTPPRSQKAGTAPASNPEEDGTGRAPTNGVAPGSEVQKPGDSGVESCSADFRCSGSLRPLLVKTETTANLTIKSVLPRETGTRVENLKTGLTKSSKPLESTTAPYGIAAPQACETRHAAARTGYTVGATARLRCRGLLGGSPRRGLGAVGF